jgi:flavin reductase (DIM6/NTAB) family NADH-FMN oxidoreductase RutF/rubredoxin
MDMSVLWKLSYGMYAIGTLDGTRPTGCIVNTVAQITSDNPVIAVSMNKNNFTYEAIKKTGRFTVSILTEKSNPNVISCLGFCSGRDRDKFNGKDFAWKEIDGLPVVKDNCAGHIVAEVVSMTEMETHYIILARVKDAVACSNYTPMTYKYYHEVIKGSAPKNAPTYQAPSAKKDSGTATEKWVCTICGYVYEGDLTKEPDDWVCPICKQPKSKFVKQ